MSESNNKKDTKKKKKKRSGLKTFFIILLLVLAALVGTVGGIVVAIAKDAPKIDPTNIQSLLNQTSFILDSDGNVIEKIQTKEYRTIVELDKIPPYLQQAFISIEDERFEKHIGVDPKGIMSALVDNIKARSTVRGASTITQQLARNLYLSNEKKLDRKIKEAYLALQIEKALTKDQILEAYLNRIYLGQGAYGVQAAAQTYFSKNVDELTIAESAVLAGIIKSPKKYQPYIRVRPEDFNDKSQIQVGQVDVLGEKYIAVYNDESVKRQQLVLKKMKELGYINDAQYKEALNEDIKENLKPGQKKIKGISSYFTDYVKVQVMDTLISQLGYTEEQAEKELYTGGLKIYSTMDVGLQHKIEEIYSNFTEILYGNTDNTNGPILISWSLDGNNNIVDENKNVVYFKQENILDGDMNLIIENGTFSLENNTLIINNRKLRPYKNHIDIVDYYNIDDKKNLVTHNMGSLSIGEDLFSVGENKKIVIKENFLNNNKDFYKVDENNNLIIDSKYFYRSEDGIVQPQSATVIMDYRTGEIKALVGGRDIKGSKLLNRATSAKRQPGSSIKPVAVYLPALDNGFTAASVIDDIPHYNQNGDLWPNNWNRKYTGLNSLRRSVEQSINVNSVKTLEAIGIDTSLEYLTRMGIIHPDHPETDSFVSRSENEANNDENLSALGLGGMTNGLTPLELTAAYGSIANGGTYVEPIAFTKILDKDGNVLLENTPNKNTVVSPEVAYVMTDILKTTVTNGLAQRAQIPNMPTAGKTGTTQEKADVWFVGYTPYYVAGVWIGNDSPKIKLSSGSSMAAQLWKNIMTKAHEKLEHKNFEAPANIVYVDICTQSGKLPTELCSHDPRGSCIRKEIFVRGTEPIDFCETHVEVDVCPESNKIANEYCPSTVKKVFIKRDPPYDPSEHNGIVPDDYQYTAPFENCDIHNQENTIDDYLEDWFDEEDDEENDEENPPTDKPKDDQHDNHENEDKPGNDNNNNNDNEDNLNNND